MAQLKPLSADALYTRCDSAKFGFETTDDLDELSTIIGQSRAEQAVHFGVGIRREGYNLYAMGPSGLGKHALVHGYLKRKAAEQSPPSDWCYVNNFDQTHKPKALRLPAGRGAKFAHDVAQFIEELSAAIPAAFEGKEYQASAQAIDKEYKEQQEESFEELAEEAARDNIRLFRTPAGFAFAPVKDDKVLGPEEFQRLPEEEQKWVEALVSRLQERLQAILQKVPLWRKESREKLKKLNHDVTMSAVGHFLEDLKASYSEFPDVLAYLDRASQDVVENIDDFRRTEADGETITPNPTPSPTEHHRYKVNVLVDNQEMEGAPVVYQDHPTYHDLVGRAEHLAQFGTLVTDFTLLKPGALHRANGGYLLLDAHKVLTHPFAWEGLKRALYNGRVSPESLDKMLNLVTTVSLEPEAIPLDVKVVLLGDRYLYYLLSEFDPDFGELFKVAADFEERIDRNEQNDMLYARLIATLAKKEKLRPFDRKAVARVIEYGARLVEDSEKLSTHMRSVADLLREADYWAGNKGRELICAEDIDEAIEHQLYRSSRVKEHLQEEILRGTILIDTTESQVGQVNGLSVLNFGTHSFGQPSRITATVHIGEGQVVDIEREVELGGAIHTKGVLILSSFLAARYAQKHPLSLSASLVFEQNYGGVEGDSASLGELCALLSALANLPIRQSLAITGSVNQHGRAQAIGGVNEKIEGFFEVCSARGLDGSQGVIIPASNAKHLMLRSEVVEAARAGLFHVYAVETVDQAISLLTGEPAGELNRAGHYPAKSINGRAQARLMEMSTIRASFGDHHKEKLAGHDD